MRLRSIVCLCLLASACSSGYSSGVDGAKPFSTLTTVEAMTACENLNEYLQNTFSRSVQSEFNCYVAALSEEVTPEGCQAAFEACLVSPPSTPLNLEPIDCSTATMGDPTCNAHVSEVEQCITASANAYRDRIDELDCSIAGNIPELMRVQQPLAVPAECSELGATCPSFAGGIMGDDG